MGQFGLLEQYLKFRSRYSFGTLLLSGEVLDAEHPHVILAQTFLNRLLESFDVYEHQRRTVSELISCLHILVAVGRYVLISPHLAPFERPVPEVQKAYYIQRPEIVVPVFLKQLLLSAVLLDCLILHGQRRIIHCSLVEVLLGPVLHLDQKSVTILILAVNVKSRRPVIFRHPRMFVVSVLQMGDLQPQQAVQKFHQNLFAANSSQHDLKTLVQGQVCVTVKPSIDQLILDPVDLHKSALGPSVIFIAHDT